MNTDKRVLTDEQRQRKNELSRLNRLLIKKKKEHRQSYKKWHDINRRNYCYW
jgi:hypothetical protein